MWIYLPKKWPVPYASTTIVIIYCLQILSPLSPLAEKGEVVRGHIPDLYTHSL